MRRAAIVFVSCVAVGACTPLLGLGGLRFEDGGGGAGGEGDAGGTAKPGAALWATGVGADADDGALAIAFDGADVWIDGCFGKRATASDAGPPSPDPSSLCTSPAAPFVAQFSGTGKRKRLDLLPIVGAATARALAVGKSGQVFVAGDFNGSLFDGALELESAGAIRPFVAALGDGPTPAWTSDLDASATGDIEAMTLDGPAPIVAGSFTSSIGGLSPATGVAAFWAELGASGSKITGGAQARQQNSADQSVALAVATDSGGEVVFGGVHVGALDDAPTTVSPESDGFVIRSTPGKPKPKWTTTVGGPGNQTVSSVAFDRSGAILIGGWFEGQAKIGKKKLTALGSIDGFVAKLSAAGEPLWLKAISGPAEETVRALAVDDDGNVYVAGSASPGATIDDKSILNHGGVDGFLAKLGPDGAVAWLTSFGSTGDDRAYALTLGPTAVYVAGTFNGMAEFGAKKLKSEGGVDAFVAAFGR